MAKFPELASTMAKSPERKTRNARVSKAPRKERDPRKEGLTMLDIPAHCAHAIIEKLKRMGYNVYRTHAALLMDTEMSGTDEESELTEDEPVNFSYDEDIEMFNMDFAQRPPVKADVVAKEDIVMPDQPQSPIYDGKMELDSPRPKQSHISFVRGQTLSATMSLGTATQMWHNINNQDNVNVATPGQFIQHRALPTAAAAAAQNHWASYQYQGSDADVTMGEASNVNVQAPAAQHWGFSNHWGSNSGFNAGATVNAPAPYPADNDVAMRGLSPPPDVSTQWHVPGGACSAAAPADQDVEMGLEDAPHGLSTQWPAAAHGFPATGSADSGVKIKVEEPEDLPASQWAAPAQASSTAAPTGLQLQGFGQSQAYSQPSSTFASLFPTAQPSGANAGAASSAQPVIKEEEEEEYDPEWLSSGLDANASSQSSGGDQLFPTFAAPAPAAQQYSYDEDADMSDY